MTHQIGLWPGVDPVDGWERLQRDLDAARETRKVEVLFWAAVLAWAMFLTVVVVATACVVWTTVQVIL